VLARIKFSQIGERRNWEGINVHYSGIPGNISLNINERVLLFKQEMEGIQAAEIVLNLF